MKNKILLLLYQKLMMPNYSNIPTNNKLIKVRFSLNKMFMNNKCNKNNRNKYNSNNNKRNIKTNNKKKNSNNKKILKINNKIKTRKIYNNNNKYRIRIYNKAKLQNKINKEMIIIFLNLLSVGKLSLMN